MRVASINLCVDPFADFMSPNPHNPLRDEGNVIRVIIFKTRKIELQGLNNVPWEHTQLRKKY